MTLPSAFSAAGILLSQPRFHGAASGGGRGGPVLFTAALENSKKFLCLASICNLCGTQTWFYTIATRTLSFTVGLCVYHKRKMLYRTGIRNPKKQREKFIKPTVMINRKDKQAKFVHEKKYLGKKYISKSLV